jgi:hypothetical protein
MRCNSPIHIQNTGYGTNGGNTTMELNTNEALKALVNKYGLVVVLGMLEEIAATSNSKCPIAQAICDGLHMTINKVSVVILKSRLKLPGSK